LTYPHLDRKTDNHNSDNPNNHLINKFFNRNTDIDTMGALPKEAIILIVILSAGCAVLIAWAFHSVWTGQKGVVKETGVIDDGEQQQAAYRRDVVERHHADIAASLGIKYPQSRYSEV
jgi:hypothetical protein